MKKLGLHLADRHPIPKVTRKKLIGCIHLTIALKFIANILGLLLRDFSM